MHLMIDLFGVNDGLHPDSLLEYSILVSLRVSQAGGSISSVLFKAWAVPDHILIFEECVSFVFSPPSPCRWMVCGQMCVCV